MPKTRSVELQTSGMKKKKRYYDFLKASRLIAKIRNVRNDFITNFNLYQQKIILNQSPKTIKDMFDKLIFDFENYKKLLIRHRPFLKMVFSKLLSDGNLPIGMTTLITNQLITNLDLLKIPTSIFDV